MTNLAHLVVIQADNVAEDLVGFGDQLHVAILDAIMHHLDEVAGSVFAHPVTAWLAICFGCNALEDVFDGWPAKISTTINSTIARQKQINRKLQPRKPQRISGRNVK